MKLYTSKKICTISVDGVKVEGDNASGDVVGEIDGFGPGFLGH